MKTPQYHLKRIDSDGSESEAEIFPVTKLPWQEKMGRRGFLGAGLTTSAALLLLNTLPARAQDQEQTPEAPECPSPEKLLQAHSDKIVSLAVSPDDTFLASLDSEAVLKLWQMPEGEPVASTTVGGKNVSLAAFTPDSLAILTNTGRKNIKIWSTEALQALLSIDLAATPTAVAQFSDGLQLAIADEQGTIQIRSMLDGSVTRSWKAHLGKISDLLLSPDDRLLISAGADGLINLWETGGFTRSASLDVGSSAVTALALEKKRAALAAAHADLRLVEWRNFLASSQSQLICGDCQVAHFAYQPGAAILAYATGKIINIFDTASDQVIDMLSGHQADITELTFSQDGRLMISGSSDGAIMIWDTAEWCFQSFLFDPKANSKKLEANSYRVYDEVSGTWITYTLPCGSPIPAGAICTCNCVAGSYTTPTTTTTTTRTYCSCNKVCVCIPVYY